MRVIGSSARIKPFKFSSENADGTFGFPCPAPTCPMKRPPLLILAVLLLATSCATQREQKQIDDRRQTEMAERQDIKPTALGGCVQLAGQALQALAQGCCKK
jgi:hypothetical protein